MESPPVTKPYFSPDRGREKLWLAVCWAVVVVCTAILYFKWEQTRSMDVIIYLQQYRSILPVEYLFQFFTFLGNDEFYMLFFGILIWCVSKPLGFWTAAVLLVSGLVSGSIKDLTVMERPYLEGMKQLDSHAFPSGHTLTAVTVWGYMAVRLKKTGFWIWAVAAMVLIAFSRIVLGYHFVGDILGGYAIGIPVLLLLIWISALFVEKGWHEKFSRQLLLALCIIIPVVLTVVVPSSDIPKLMGLFAGASVGYIVEQEKIRSNTKTRWYFQVIKAVLGVAVLFGIIMGLSGILSSDNEVLQIGFITLRRRSKKMLSEIFGAPPSSWQRIHLPALTRQYRNPRVMEKQVKLKGCQAPVRQLAITELGHEEPTILLTNQLDASSVQLITRYAQRMIIENGIAEAINFFHLDALSSMVGLKVDFDLQITLIAGSLYRLMSERIGREYVKSTAKTLFRKIFDLSGRVTITEDEVVVRFARKAHNPFLIAAGFAEETVHVPWLDGKKLLFNFS